MFLLDLMPVKALSSSKKSKYRIIFPGEFVLNMTMPDRNDSQVNYPEGYPGYLFGIVIYTVLGNKGSESFQEYSTGSFCYTPRISAG